MSQFNVLLMIDKNEIDEKLEGFLCMHTSIPFAPFDGLEIMLHALTDGGWWDQVIVRSVSWDCQGNQFECDVQIPYADSAEKLDILSEKGWEPL